MPETVWKLLPVVSDSTSIAGLYVQEKTLSGLMVSPFRFLLFDYDLGRLKAYWLESY